VQRVYSDIYYMAQLKLNKDLKYKSATPLQLHQGYAAGNKIKLSLPPINKQYNG
jgi:hypothetical protein